MLVKNEKNMLVKLHPKKISMKYHLKKNQLNFMKKKSGENSCKNNFVEISSEKSEISMFLRKIIFIKEISVFFLKTVKFLCSF